jgi:hypothetical protein
MDEGKSVGINLIWAITMLIVVAIIAGAIYYTGIITGNQKKEVDVKVDIPAPTKSN